MPVEINSEGIRIWGEQRRTPFSQIDLDPNYDRLYDACLETMGVELEEAVLVVRGKHQGRTVEFMVGSLKTTGPDNGMVLIHRQEWADLNFGGSRAYRTPTHEEFRVLIDAELVPDKNGHAYTIRVHEEQGF